MRLQIDIDWDYVNFLGKEVAKYSSGSGPENYENWAKALRIYSMYLASVIDAGKEIL